jgi:hypothetical protein
MPSPTPHPTHEDLKGLLRQLAKVETLEQMVDPDDDPDLPAMRETVMFREDRTTPLWWTTSPEAFLRALDRELPSLSRLPTSEKLRTVMSTLRHMLDAQNSRAQSTPS